MKFKRSTILELKQILEKEFNFVLNNKDLEKLAYSLVGYFDLLIKIDHRQKKFGNSSSPLIDINDHKLEDRCDGDENEK